MTNKELEKTINQIKSDYDAKFAELESNLQVVAEVIQTLAKTVSVNDDKIKAMNESLTTNFKWIADKFNSQADDTLKNLLRNLTKLVEKSK